ncbi:MAG: hypothetical protein O3B13_25145 [Planctomycetota bacterium]|nr:hypothetical protein [Planctomycetota bacterium]
MAPVLTILHEGSLNAGTGGIGGESWSLRKPACSCHCLAYDHKLHGRLPQRGLRMMLRRDRSTSRPSSTD